MVFLLDSNSSEPGLVDYEWRSRVSIVSVMGGVDSVVGINCSGINSLSPQSTSVYPLKLQPGYAAVGLYGELEKPAVLH